MTSRFSCDYRGWTMLLAAVVWLAACCPGRSLGQTTSLPPPAASSLDRLAQAPSGYGTPLSPPPPTWDPFAPQATQLPPQQPAVVVPQQPFANSAMGGQPGYPGYSTTAPNVMPTQGTAGQPQQYLFPPGYPQQNSSFQQTMRLFQGIRGSWAYLAGDGQGTNVAVNELDTTATFAIPFFHNSPANLNHAPLLVTPGFGLQLWDGPQTTATMLADLPPNTYDGFLDAAWNPQFTPLFGAELGVRVGVFTNWDVFTNDSWRIMGRGIGTINLTPTMQGKLGVVYLDRNLVKILPAGGITWTPNADSRYDIFFPAPRASHRIINVNKHSIWWYLAGEYGGGAWTFRRSTGQISPFDYNDIRVTLGTEWMPVTATGLAGNFEIGYVFYRQLFFVDGPPQYQNLDDTFMFRLGLAY
ncbi:MAG: hypothetical protein O2946_00840 [Planctomycetota bacterium]|jgi:hypothetical protein|nr:hypothetical protein [Planctomycetota bacterium]MDA0970003.1 hypothetical protein [Planctomycetota bacterium]